LVVERDDAEVAEHDFDDADEAISDTAVISANRRRFEGNSRKKQEREK
jgi:hypothetical protein